MHYNITINSSGGRGGAGRVGGLVGGGLLMRRGGEAWVPWDPLSPPTITERHAVCIVCGYRGTVFSLFCFKANTSFLLVAGLYFATFMFDAFLIPADYWTVEGIVIIYIHENTY